MAIDWDHQENRPGSLATSECLVSVAKAEQIYQATVDVWPWQPSPTGEANRAVIPLHFLEEGVKDSPVADDWGTWTVANGYGVLTSCAQLGQLELTYEFIAAEGGLATPQAEAC